MEKHLYRFTYMRFEQLNNEIDRMPCIFMKALMIKSILKQRPDYRYKNERKK